MQVFSFSSKAAAAASALSSPEPFELQGLFAHKGHLLVTSLHVTDDEKHLLIGARVMGFASEMMEGGIKSTWRAWVGKIV